MKYLLDTNMFIYAQKGNPSVLKQLHKHMSDGLAISSITLAELEYGVSASSNPQKNLLSLTAMLSIFEILPFDADAAAEYGAINATLRRAGTPIGTMDTLIAAHARSLNLTVITHNTREFQRVEGLMLEDWYE